MKRNIILLGQDIINTGITKDEIMTLGENVFPLTVEQFYENGLQPINLLNDVTVFDVVKAVYTTVGDSKKSVIVLPCTHLVTSFLNTLRKNRISVTLLTEDGYTQDGIEEYIAGLSSYVPKTICKRQVVEPIQLFAHR